MSDLSFSGSGDLGGRDPASFPSNDGHAEWLKEQEALALCVPGEDDPFQPSMGGTPSTDTTEEQTPAPACLSCFEQCAANEAKKEEMCAEARATFVKRMEEIGCNGTTCQRPCPVPYCERPRPRRRTTRTTRTAAAGCGCNTTNKSGCGCGGQ